MPKGKINPRWEAAASIAREGKNETPQNIKRVLKEFKEIESAGYSIDIAIACWRWLRTREEFPIAEARLTTALKGSPVYIEQFKTACLEDVPPVFDADAHDKYVVNHAAILARLGFVYRAENMPNRLTTERLIQIGLKSEEK